MQRQIRTYTRALVLLRDYGTYATAYYYNYADRIRCQLKRRPPGPATMPGVPHELQRHNRARSCRLENTRTSMGDNGVNVVTLQNMLPLFRYSKGRGRRQQTNRRKSTKNPHQPIKKQCTVACDLSNRGPRLWSAFPALLRRGPHRVWLILQPTHVSKGYTTLSSTNYASQCQHRSERRLRSDSAVADDLENATSLFGAGPRRSKGWQCLHV